jgi:hypothetical protein
VTTTALAVAARWPQEVDGGVRPVMVEADASGGDLIIRFGLPTDPSILAIAATAGKPHPGSLLGAVNELPFGGRAVVAVPGRGPCTAAVRLLAEESGQRVLLGGDRDRGTVLLDVGRLNDDVEPLLKAADKVVLVARGGAESLTHISAYGADTRAFSGRLTLAIVGPCPYPVGEITKTLGIDRVLFLPWHTKSVTEMTRRKPGVLRTTRFRSRPLMTAAGTLAGQLAGPNDSDISAGGAVATAETDNATDKSGTQLEGGSQTGLMHAPDAEEDES